MARFIVKRVLAAMLTLLIIATITFFLMNMIPGGPFKTAVKLVKPSGGIRNYETAKMYVDMGASRLGCGYTSCKPICEGEGESSEAY